MNSDIPSLHTPREPLRIALPADETAAPFQPSLKKEQTSGRFSTTVLAAVQTGSAPASPMVSPTARPSIVSTPSAWALREHAPPVHPYGKTALQMTTTLRRLRHALDRYESGAVALLALRRTAALPDAGGVDQFAGLPPAQLDMVMHAEDARVLIQHLQDALHEAALTRSGAETQEKGSAAMRSEGISALVTTAEQLGQVLGTHSSVVRKLCDKVLVQALAMMMGVSVSSRSRACAASVAQVPASRPMAQDPGGMATTRSAALVQSYVSRTGAGTSAPAAAEPRPNSQAANLATLCDTLQQLASTLTLPCLQLYVETRQTATLTTSSSRLFNALRDQANDSGTQGEKPDAEKFGYARRQASRTHKNLTALLLALKGSKPDKELADAGEILQTLALAFENALERLTSGAQVPGSPRISSAIAATRLAPSSAMSSVAPPATLAQPLAQPIPLVPPLQTIQPVSPLPPVPPARLVPSAAVLPGAPDTPVSPRQHVMLSLVERQASPRSGTGNLSQHKARAGSAMPSPLPGSGTDPGRTAVAGMVSPRSRPRNEPGEQDAADSKARAVVVAMVAELAQVIQAGNSSRLSTQASEAVRRVMRLHFGLEQWFSSALALPGTPDLPSLFDHMALVLGEVLADFDTPGQPLAPAAHTLISQARKRVMELIARGREVALHEDTERVDLADSRKRARSSPARLGKAQAVAQTSDETIAESMPPPLPTGMQASLASALANAASDSNRGITGTSTSGGSGSSSTRLASAEIGNSAAPITSPAAAMSPYSQRAAGLSGRQSLGYLSSTNAAHPAQSTTPARTVLQRWPHAEQVSPAAVQRALPMPTPVETAFQPASTMKAPDSPRSGPGSPRRAALSSHRRSRTVNAEQKFAAAIARCQYNAMRLIGELAAMRNEIQQSPQASSMESIQASLAKLAGNIGPWFEDALAGRQPGSQIDRLCRKLGEVLEGIMALYVASNAGQSAAASARMTAGHRRIAGWLASTPALFEHLPG